MEDHLLVAIFGPVIVLLLGYSLYTTNGRFGEISDNFGEINNRFIALEARIDRRFDAQDARIDRRFDAIDRRLDAQDARIDAIDARIDAINLKLTTLIALLNKTDEVDAALAGEITASAPPAVSRDSGTSTLSSPQGGPLLAETSIVIVGVEP